MIQLLTTNFQGPQKNILSEISSWAALLWAGENRMDRKTKSVIG